jgi:hypothetical protein
MKNSVFFLLLMVVGMARGQGVLNRQQWDAVEGVYQLTGNANMFIRFTDRDGELVARFLWDADAEVHFLPDSGLVFDRKDEGEGGRVHIRFRKDERGRVVHVTMGNGTEWDRSGVVMMSPGRLKLLAGSYRSIEDPDNVIMITATDSSLVVKQAWDGHQTVVVPFSDTFFYAREAFYTIVILPPGGQNSPREIRLMGRYTFKLIGK